MKSSTKNKEFQLKIKGKTIYSYFMDKNYILIGFVVKDNKEK